MQNNIYISPSDAVFFDDQGHLNDTGLAVAAEQSVQTQSAAMPQALSQHLEECAKCQMNVLMLTELAQADETPEIPVLPPARRTGKVRRLSQGGFRTLRRVAAVLLIGTVAWGASLWWLKSPVDPETRWVSAFHNPVLSPDFKQWELDNAKNHIIRLPSGTEVEIKAYSFINRAGKPVQGKVQVQFRELHDAADVLATGVPVDYDTLGRNSPLETAGMFEIRAFQYGKALEIRPDQPLSVFFVSTRGEADFSQYYLREQTIPQREYTLPVLTSKAYADHKNTAIWQYQGSAPIVDTKPTTSPDVLRQITEKRQHIARLQSQIQERQNVAHTTPSNLTSRTPKPVPFKLQLNFSNDAVLHEYEYKTFVFAGEDPADSPTNKNAWVLREKWDNVQLCPTKYRALTLKEHKGAVNTGAYTPDGTRLATGGSDGKICLWTNEAQYLNTLQGHTAAIQSLQYAADGYFLISASDDGTARVWHKDGKMVMALQGHQAGVREANFLPDNKGIITQGRDNTVRFWNMQGKQRFVYPHFSPHKATLSRDGEYLLTIDKTNQLLVWRATTGEIAATIKGNFQVAQFTPDGQYIIALGQNPYTGKAICYTKEGREMARFNWHDDQLLLSPNGQNIISYSANYANLWHLNRRQTMNTILMNKMKSLLEDPFKGHSQAITDIRYNAAGTQILSTSLDGTARLWQRDGSLLYVLRGHSGAILSGVFSPNNQQILTLSADGTAKLWNPISTPNNDKLDLYLYKNRQHFVGRERDKITIEAKQFYCCVRITNEEAEINPDEMTAQASTQLELVKLQEEYARELTALQTLEQNTLAGLPNKVRRVFSIKRCGAYQCARPYRLPATAKKIRIDLRPETSQMPIAVYLLRGKYLNVMQTLPNATLLYFDAGIDEPIAAVVVLPNNRVLRFEMPNIAKQELEQMGEVSLTLRQSGQMYNRIEWESFLAD